MTTLAKLVVTSFLGNDPSPDSQVNSQAPSRRSDSTYLKSELTVLVWTLESLAGVRTLVRRAFFPELNLVNKKRSFVFRTLDYNN